MSPQETTVQGKEDNEQWRQTREKVLNRDSYECQFCGTTNEEHQEENDRGLDVHHIIPRSDGGQDTMRNLVALCRSCHQTMESLHGQAMEELAASNEYEETAEGAHRTWKQYLEKWDQYDDALMDFLKENPVFRRKFKFYNENDSDENPAVESYELRRLAQEIEGEISSEWECVVKFGYKEGIADVVSELDGRTEVPIEEFEKDD